MRRGYVVAYATLEDFFGDIVGKARQGQGISEADLARTAGLTPGEIGQIESYALTPDDERIHALAKALNLNGEKLAGIARGWVPVHSNASFERAALAVDRTILNVGMEVNCYGLKCKRTGEGALIDAGGQARRILDMVDRMQVRVTHILLTHGHGDHVGALREMKEATGGRVCCCERDFSLLGGLEPLVDEVVEEGWETEVGALKIEAVSLPGHTSGGIGYGTDGVFFSGDALFAGSLGGARGAAYTGQIEAVRRKVLCRDEKVWIFPGHGPITTVEEERAHNPFFA